MTLIQSFSALHNGANVLQRALVGLNGRTYRRIAALVTPYGGTVTEILPTPVWQEMIHTGEFHNVISRHDRLVLENLWEASFSSCRP
jgi:hypothetical protein